MLKKLAHNSTIPSLAGNSDIRPLQDLILAEKTVLVSLQKLSVDFTKASEALRLWAFNEGDDLADTLNVSANLLSHFSSALLQYSSHEQVIRDHLKAIRTREEGLDDMKRRRKSLLTKADSADKKLSKMGSEHKQLTVQTDLLNKLNADIKLIEGEIVVEETSLADFKRMSARALLAHKFGGMLEFCEKGTVFGEIGKLVASEIPDDVTQPGGLRNPYKGHMKVESLAAEAQRRVETIKFTESLSSPTATRTQVPSRPAESPSNNGYGQPIPPPPPASSPWTPPGQPQPNPGYGQSFVPPPASNPWTPSDQSQSNPSYPANAQGLDRKGLSDSLDRPALSLSDPGPYPRQGGPTAGPAVGPDLPPLPQQRTPSQQRTVDDFGVTNVAPSGAGGGRFATFPVKSNRAPPDLALPRNEGAATFNRLGSIHMQSDSFSSSIAAAIGQSPTFSPGHQMSGSIDSTYRRRSVDAESNPMSYVPPGSLLPDDPWKDESSSQEELQLAYTTGPPEPPQAPEVNQGGNSGKHVRFGATSLGGEPSDGNWPPEERDGSAGSPIPAGQPVTSEHYQPAGFDVDRTPTVPQFQDAAAPPLSRERGAEMALNAALAREIGRELEALQTDPSSPIPLSQLPHPGSELSPSTSMSPIHPGPHTPHDLSPLQPPSVESWAQSNPPLSPSHSYAASSYPAPQGPESLTGPASPIEPISPVHSTPLPVLPPINMSGPEIEISAAPPPPPYWGSPEPPFSRGPPLVTTDVNRSTSSLTPSHSPSGSMGSRTIAAAAFKRPQGRVISGPGALGGDVGPGASLSPRVDEMGTQRVHSDSYARYRGPQTQNQQSPPLSATSSYSQQQQQLPAVPSGDVGSAGSEDSHYDYISAFINSSTSSAESGPPAALRPAGYGQGRFTTDLEGGLR